MAVADALATSFGKLGFAGRGNGLEDDPNVSKQPGEHGNGKGSDEKGPGDADQPHGNKAEDEESREPEVVQTWNFMVDLFVPGHFPSQSAARRYLQNLMSLGQRVGRLRIQMRRQHGSRQVYS